jgi:hypothetical protein
LLAKSCASIAGARTEAVFRGERPGRWGNIVDAARRKLDMLDAAEVLADLRSPPGNRLERLGGDRAGQYSSLAASAPHLDSGSTCRQLTIGQLRMQRSEAPLNATFNRSQLSDVLVSRNLGLDLNLYETRT